MHLHLHLHSGIGCEKKKKKGTMAATKEQQQQEFKDRLERLKTNVLSNRSQIGRKNIVTRAPKKSKIPALKENVHEAELCLTLLCDLDDGVPSPQYAMVASQRQLAGLPSVPPSNMKATAHSMLKLALASLGEALEAAGLHGEALPVYHAQVKQTEIAMVELWEPASEWVTTVNNLALCYKRLGRYDRAAVWYKRALELAMPGSPEEKLLQDNIKTLKGISAGPATLADNISGSTRSHKVCCWNCGKNAVSDPDLKFLLKCTICKEKKLALPGYYCGVKCQKDDWKRHKIFHKEIAAKQKVVDRNSFESVDEATKEALNDPNFVADSEFEYLMAKAVRYSMKGNLKKAVKFNKKAIAVDPKNPLGHHNLAELLRSNLSYEDSIHEFLEAMELADEKIKEGKGTAMDHEVWARSAATVYATLQNNTAYAGLSKPEWMTNPNRLLLSASRATETVPSYNETWGMLGDALLACNDAERAAKCYRQAETVSEADINRNKFKGKAFLAEKSLTA